MLVQLQLEPHREGIDHAGTGGAHVLHHGGGCGMRRRVGEVELEDLDRAGELAPLLLHCCQFNAVVIGAPVVLVQQLHVHAAASLVPELDWLAENARRRGNDRGVRQQQPVLCQGGQVQRALANEARVEHLEDQNVRLADELGRLAVRLPAGAKALASGGKHAARVALQHNHLGGQPVAADDLLGNVAHVSAQLHRHDAVCASSRGHHGQQAGSRADVQHHDLTRRSRQLLTCCSPAMHAPPPSPPAWQPRCAQWRARMRRFGSRRSACRCATSGSTRAAAATAAGCW